MKKENKKMAQERRAIERKKQEQREKIKGILIIAIPAIIILLLLAWVISDAVKQSSSSDSNTEITSELTDTDTDSDTDSVTTTDEEETGTTLYTGTDVAVADGDTVNIDYVGYMDGVAFSGGDTQGMGADLVIGSGSYIDDFEEQLIGHYVGETVEVNVTFPEDYGSEDFNGKDATFEVVINGIYQ
jgi:trigger factor